MMFGKELFFQFTCASYYFSNNLTTLVHWTCVIVESKGESEVETTVIWLEDYISLALVVLQGMIRGRHYLHAVMKKKICKS